MASSGLKNKNLFSINGNGSLPPQPPQDTVTHEELNHSIDNITNKIELSNSHVTNDINILSVKITHLKTVVWWVFGVLVSGILLPLLMMLIKILFFN